MKTTKESAPVPGIDAPVAAAKVQDYVKKDLEIVAALIQMIRSEPLILESIATILAEKQNNRINTQEHAGRI